MGRRIKGLLLVVSFWSSSLFAAYYLSHIEATRELVIGLLALVLVLLIWSYHVVEIREFEKRGTAAESIATTAREEQTVAAHRPKIRQSSGKRVSGVVEDELYTKGRIAYLRGSMDEAKSCFEKILGTNRTDCDAAFQLGRIYRTLGDSRQAERFFRQCEQAPGGSKWSEEIKKYLQENKG